MTSARAALVACLASVATACGAPSAGSTASARTTDPPPAASPSASAPATPAPPAPRPLDADFRQWERKLPAAATLSEQNGMSIRCADDRHATLTLLDATARKVKIEGDDDLQAAARWARNADPCIRQIALDAIVPAVGYDADKLVVPSMHDVEHHLFHDIFVSIESRLDAHGTKLDAATFEGLELGLDARATLARLRGSWLEEIESKNFQYAVEVDDGVLSVTHRRVPPDPARDDTWKTGFDGATQNERGQTIVRGAWSAQRHGDEEHPRQTPSPFVYAFWLVARDVVWFRPGESAYWVKLRRVSPR